MSMPEIKSDVNESWLETNLQAETDVLNAQIAEMQLEMEKASSAAAFANRENIEAQKRAQEMREKANAEQTRIFDIRKAIRKAEQDVASLLRRRELIEKNRSLKADYEEAATFFEQLTASAAWRDFAMDHQKLGSDNLAHAKRGILGDTMGLGKSLTILMTADKLQAKRILVVLPSTVVRSFNQEIERWSPERKLIKLQGTNKHQRRLVMSLLPDMEEFICTINYEAWRKDTKLIEELIAAKFDMVVLDEAHMIKDRNSNAFKGVEKIVFAENLNPEVTINGDDSWFRDCSVKHVFPMTGTPILNKPQDLFSLLNLVDRANFFAEYDYLRDYCEMDLYTSKWKFKPGGLETLATKMSSFFVRRTKESAGIKLPEKTVQIHDLTLDPDMHPGQFRAAQELNKHAAIFLEDGRAMAVAAVIALITRKRQVMTWPAGIEVKDTDKDSNTYQQVLLKIDIHESVKVDAAMDIIDEVIFDEKVVLFSQFKAPLHEIAERCKRLGYTVGIIEGDTSMAQREILIHKFQDVPLRDPNGIDIILGNFKAMGVGVTLTAATQMIILDEEWNPGKNEQAYDRIHRIGQDKPVTIHVLRVQNSIDTWMADLNTQKADIVDGFVQATDYQAELREAIVSGGML